MHLDFKRRLELEQYQSSEIGWSWDPANHGIQYATFRRGGIVVATLAYQYDRGGGWSSDALHGTIIRDLDAARGAVEVAISEGYSLAERRKEW